MRIATPIYTISSTTSTIYSTNVNGTVVQVQEVQSRTMHHSSTTSTFELPMTYGSKHTDEHKVVLWSTIVCTMALRLYGSTVQMRGSRG